MHYKNILKYLQLFQIELHRLRNALKHPLKESHGLHNNNESFSLRNLLKKPLLHDLLSISQSTIST